MYRRFAYLPWLVLLVAWSNAHAAPLLFAPDASPAANGPKETPSQEPAATEPAAAPPGKEAPNGAVRQTGPDTFYLRDSKGNLVLVPDLSYEDFKRLYDLDQRLTRSQEPPRYSLQRARVTGTVDKLRAQFDVQFTVLLRDDNWVRVPLGLSRAVLREPLKHSGAGEIVVDYDRGEGYVAWARGPRDRSVDFTLKFLAAVQESAGEYRLPLPLARAAASQLTLTVDAASAVPARREIVQRGLPDGKTEFTYWGLDDQTEIVWLREGAGASLPVLEVASSWKVRVEGPTRTTSEARLRVRSFSTPFDRFQVRLPAGARLLPGETTGYRITTAPGKSPEEGALASVVLDRKTQQAGEIALHVEHRPAAEESLEIAGFEVLDAAQQSGQIDVSIAGDWSVRFLPGGNVRQLDVGEIPGEPLAARFEYARQPFSLKLSVQRRANIISVEPTYVFQPGAGTLRLEARLRYMVRGAKASALNIDLTGWQLESDSLEPAGLIDAAALNPTQLSPLVAPLKTPMQGEIELVLRARRPMPAAGEALKLAPPLPQANLVAPALWVVLPDDNVELKPAESPTNLAAESLPAGVKLPARQQSPLVYRESGSPGNSTWQGDWRVFARSVQAETNSLVKLTSREAEVEQKWTYRIAYEPLDRVLFSAPSGATPKLELLPERTPLAFSPVTAPLESSVPEGFAMFAVTLPQPRLGNLELLLSYRWPVAESSFAGATPVSVPLAFPKGEARFSPLRNSLRLVAEEGLQTDLDEQAWRLQASPSAEPGLYATAEGVMNEVRLRVSRSSPQAAKATVVERCWLQTRLSANQRQDTAVWRISTSEPALFFRMPAGAIVAKADVLVNGQRVQAQPQGDDRLRVDLPRSASTSTWLVEFWCPAEGRPRVGGGVMELPRLEGAPWTRHTYWQLVLPEEEQLLYCHAGLASENVWRRQGWFWNRAAKLNNAELAAWMGSQAASESGPAGYLFSSFGDAAQVELATMRRRDLLLMCSGAALVVGLALLYLPVLRHPATALVGAAALCVASGSWPETMAVVGEAALLGALLAVVAAMLRRKLLQRGLRPAEIHGAWEGGVRPALPRGDSSLRRPGSSQATTIAAQTAMPQAGLEARP